MNCLMTESKRIHSVQQIRIKNLVFLPRCQQQTIVGTSSVNYKSEKMNTPLEIVICKIGRKREETQPIFNMRVLIF